MGYEIFQREVTRVTTPAITLSLRGRLVFNVAATKILNDAGIENAFLLWDGEQRKFAVKATSKKDPRTVKIRYSTNKKWAAISAKGFLEHIGHDMTKTLSYPTSWNEDENMFEVALADAQDTAQEATHAEASQPNRTRFIGRAGVRQVGR